MHYETLNFMCTLTIDVVEERIVKSHPWINRDVLNHYFQQKADEILERLIEDPFYDSPISHTEEGMKVIVKEPFIKWRLVK